MNFLRRPEGQVLESRSGSRGGLRDIVVKLNTGGGKTLVGLLMAKSSLTEGKGPVAYLVTDNYLVDQVVAEAADRRMDVAHGALVQAGMGIVDDDVCGRVAEALRPALPATPNTDLPLKSFWKVSTGTARPWV